MSDDPDHGHGHGSVGDYSRGGDHVVFVTTATLVVETSPDYWWRPCPCQSGVGQSWRADISLGLEQSRELHGPLKEEGGTEVWGRVRNQFNVADLTTGADLNIGAVVSW